MHWVVILVADKASNFPCWYGHPILFAWIPETAGSQVSSWPAPDTLYLSPWMILFLGCSAMVMRLNYT